MILFVNTLPKKYLDTIRQIILKCLQIVHTNKGKKHRLNTNNKLVNKEKRIYIGSYIAPT